ncbi:hypothetical protein QYE76_003687 [Lolium multiflorum]|uniref:Uncharacterized protein n=1 Tax=Lolium multiflorum TaxID=4521 RepID=A0AAD8VZG8_LOLMU|nr:hypothetical protein QYE76_003687 [Lolium multiflorum]
MPEDWEWGLRPLSSTNPPTQEAKDRFPGIESDRRGRCRKRGLDKFDPDPVIHWRDLKMGRTAASRLGKSPPEPADVPSDNINPQVHEHVAPLQAEAGQEFVDKLMAQGKKNKTPASDAGSSQAPPPSASGPNLSRDLNSSSSLKPGTVWCRHHLCLPSGRHNKFGARGPYTEITARRRTLPPLLRPKTPAPATRAPGKNCRAGGTFGNRGHANASTNPRTSRDCAQAAAATLKITDFLKGASRGKAADGSASSGSQPLVLHVGPAAVVVQEKPSGLLGRIVELKREGKDLGHLLPYAQKWNDADISAATRGLGKDRLPAPDPAPGPLKNTSRGSSSTADARKALFEELLWEHRDLAEAHSKCQAIPEASIEALKAQVAALQAEKEQLIRDHQKALEAQKEISRELKDQAIQAGVRHAEELKAAESAAEARLNEALEDAGNANVVLQAGLEEPPRR